MTLHEAGYRKWRAARPDMPARDALAWAKTEKTYADTLARFGSWDWTDERGYYGAFATADLQDGPEHYVVRVLVADDLEGVDWGDLDPTPDERENARAYSVSIQVLEVDEDCDETEVYSDSIGGVDVIDMPGYMQRDWEDAAAYALVEYLLGDALDFARNEQRERAYWAACDVVTVAA